MMQAILFFDWGGCNQLEYQEHDATLARYYYLLRGNPAVRVVVRGGSIADCEGYFLQTLAGFEECWGQWPGNAHLKGKRTYIVTIFAGQPVAPERVTWLFSTWLLDNYLSDFAPFRYPGGRYRTKIHPRKE